MPPLVRIRWDYRAPLSEAGILCATGWTFGPRNVMADHLLTLRWYPDPTWTTRALRGWRQA